MKTTQDIVGLIDNGADLDAQEVINALEDGAALASLGITDADQEAVETAHADMRLYAQSAAQYGEVRYAGKRYALIEVAVLTNRVFTGWFGDAADGEEYVSEWAANAIGMDGNQYVVKWQFDLIRGEEPEDDSNLPWDDERITDVRAA